MILPPNTFYCYRLRKDGSHIKVGKLMFHYNYIPIKQQNWHKVAFFNSDMDDTFIGWKVVDVIKKGGE